MDLTGITRRTALILMGGGGILAIFDSDAFSSSEADRSASANAANDADALISLIGFNTATAPTEPYQITITNQTSTTLNTNTIQSKANNFKFRQSGSKTKSVLPLDSISPNGGMSTVTIVTDGGTTDTVVLDLAGDSFSTSIENSLTLDSISPELVPAPATADQTSQHTWRLPTYTTTDPSVEIDTITLDYSNTGTSFDNVSTGDVTVTLTREVSSAPSRSEIGINNSSSFSGETATIDLSGSYETSVINDPNGKPNVEIVVNKVENPGNVNTYQADIRLGLSTNATDDFTADLDIIDTPFFEVSITSAPTEIFEKETFDIDYEIVNTGATQATQDIILTVDSTQEASNSGVQLAQNSSLSGTFTLDESNVSQSPPLDVVVESDDSSASRMIDVLTANEFSLTADPTTANTDSTHTWEASTTNFSGEVDTITVDYPSGFSLNGLTEEDITVTMERQLSSGPDTSTISVNSDSYSGSQATFDLSGNYNTDLVGLLKVKIGSNNNEITNTSAGQYQPTITLDGSKDTVQDDADLDIS